MDKPGNGLGLRTLLAFLLLSFGLSWGAMGLYFGIPGAAELLGAVSNHHPLFILAVHAPAISAFALILWHGGPEGLRRFLLRVLLWRAGAGWWAFLLLGVPLVYALGAALGGNPFRPDLPHLPALVGAMLFMLVLGPVEEFGWRGFALPILQRSLAPLWAALGIGVVWGLWRLPASSMSGAVQSSWSFLPFFAGSVALSVLMTALVNDAKGILLLPVLLQFQLNSPLWPDAQPYDNALFAALALVVVLVRRDRMLSRSNAVTEVMPSAPGISSTWAKRPAT